MEKKNFYGGRAACICALCGAVALHGAHQCEPRDPLCRPAYHVENSDAPPPFQQSRQVTTIVSSTAVAMPSFANWRDYLIDK